MTPITAEFRANLAKILNDTERRKMLAQGLHDTSLMVISAYKREAPVNKGPLRQQVGKTDIPDGYVVRSEAMNGGKSYPEVISRGTGKYKDGPDQGYTTGYSRASITSLVTKAGAKSGSKKARAVVGDFIDFMKIIVSNAKKRGLPYPINIRPNKFAVRAYNKSLPGIIDKFVFLVNKYSQDTFPVP